MFSDLKKFYEDLKQNDNENKLSMKDKYTILLKVDSRNEILFHDNPLVQPNIEFKRDGKTYMIYRPEYTKVYYDLLGYMNGTKPLPSEEDEEEYKKRNAFILFMLLSPLAALLVVYKLIDIFDIIVYNRRMISMIVVLAVWGIEIGIKKLIDNKGK